MGLKAKLEAIIYAAETPVTVEQLVPLVKDTVRAEGAPDDADVKSRVRAALEELVADFNAADHGIEVRQVAGGYRMSTKPEQHDVARAFAKSLKPPIRLSLPALETLAVIAYKQPVTVPEISDIRGVDSGGVIATLFDRKLITTAGRKAVVGRPILYKTTKEFLMRFGLKDVGELPSMEEFEKLVAESFEGDLPPTNGTGGPEAPPAEAAAVPTAQEDRVANEEPASGPDAPKEQQLTDASEQAPVDDTKVPEVEAEAAPEQTEPIQVEPERLIAQPDAPAESQGEPATGETPGAGDVSAPQ